MKNQILLDAVNQYGSPLYVYDSNKIKSQFNRLTESFKNVKKLQINYAVKASSNISILKYLIYMGAGIDAVSIQEVELAVRAGVDPNKIIYTPNGVSLDEIEKVAKIGAKINIDNLAVLEEFGNKHINIPVCIRINPHIMAGGNSKISVGHIDSKFGISIHQAPHIERIVENTGLIINGVHMHTGSDILDIDVFLNASEILFRIAEKFKNLDFIDFGSGFKEICQALRNLAMMHHDVQIVYPVHLNPNVRKPVRQVLTDVDNVHLIEPQDYLPFVKMMDTSYLILTDSGGIQEEAPSLGKPVLVMRNTTERPESVEAGTVKLVGTNQSKIVQAVDLLLTDRDAYKAMARAHNPYGDGYASIRIRKQLNEGIK